MSIPKIWRVCQPDSAILRILGRELGISPVVARMLVNRGIATVEEAKSFLNGSLSCMYNPLLMTDLEKAAHRVARALDRDEKILVYGDYDVDGATATAISVKVIKRLGGRVDYRVPSRTEEGYGLHRDTLARAADDGYKLVLTVDCGIAAVDEIAANNALKGPDVIITDHHEPSGVLPAAAAVINPRRADCRYPYKDLAGVGVALKLSQYLLAAGGAGDNAWTDYLDLACLGTVADIVPLTGENRIIVKYGLPRLAASESPGIGALISVSGIKQQGLGVREVGFALAPRLNAAGRVGDAARAVDLLLTEDPALARSLAGDLDRDNQDRQRVESQVMAEAMGMLDADPAKMNDRVIVLAARGWHPGVIGIVASRLVERYYRPVLLISLSDGEGRGSGRSIPGFHLYRALSSCGERLLRFGGHSQAAGLSIDPAVIGEFSRAINEYAGFIPEEVFIPSLVVDDALSLKEIDYELVRDLERLAPFGHANPGPLLACRKVKVVSCREVGRRGSHLKMVVRENSSVMDGIAFNLAGCMPEIAAAKDIDVAFCPSINEWQGRRNVQLEIKDLQPSGARWSDMHKGAFRIRDGDVDSLDRLGDLAWFPEFMGEKLLSFRDLYPGLFNDRELDFYKGRTYEEIPLQASLPADESRCGYRPGRLLDVAAAAGNTLVLVNTPARAVELAGFLNIKGIPARFLHAGVECGGGQAAADCLGGTGFKVLVSTYGVLYKAGIIPEVTVFYEMPFSAGEWAGALKSSRGEGIVLFGEADRHEREEALKSLAPGREGLLALYVYLRGVKGSSPDTCEAVTFLNERGIRATRYSVMYSLAVFSDLALAEVDPGGGSLKVKMAANKGKKNLEDSQAYQLGEEIKRNTVFWWRNLERKLVSV